MPETRPPYALAFGRQVVARVRAGRDPPAPARGFEPAARALRDGVRGAGPGGGPAGGALVPSAAEDGPARLRQGARAASGARRAPRGAKGTAATGPPEPPSLRPPAGPARVLGLAGARPAPCCPSPPRRAGAAWRRGAAAPGGSGSPRPARRGAELSSRRRSRAGRGEDGRTATSRASSAPCAGALNRPVFSGGDVVRVMPLRSGRPPARGGRCLPRRAGGGRRARAGRGGRTGGPARAWRALPPRGRARARRGG